MCAATSSSRSVSSQSDETNICIIHLADIHIRDTGRAKFQSALEHLGMFIRNIPARQYVIAVIAGDVFHYKTRLSAENIVDCYALLDCLAARAKHIIIIPGNHDANLNNETRVDLLTPIMTNCRALSNECELHYWSHSGWYEAWETSPLRFYVFSPLSHTSEEKGLGAQPPPPDDVDDPGVIRIALVHDFIDGLRIQGSSGHGPIKQEWLSQFDCVMCGHAHDYQAFNCADSSVLQGTKSPQIVYCGALTQITIGESFDKGFVLWDIDSLPGQKFARPRHRFVRLDVPGAMVKYIVSARANGSIYMSVNTIQGHDAHRSFSIPADAGRIVVEIRQHVAPDSKEVKALVDSIHRTCRATIEFAVSTDNIANEVSQKMSNATVQVQRELIEAKLRAANPQIDTQTVQAVLELHTATIEHILNVEAPASLSANTSRWSLVSLDWSNLFCYGPDNHIDFTQISGLSGLIAPNRCGKSAIIDILVLALFNETLRGSAYSIIRRGCREGALRCVWTVGAGSHKDTTAAAASSSATASSNSPPSSEGPTTHEIIRKWDLKGRTVIQYLVNGQNCTGVDLKATYAAIARSVGSIDDFVSAVLIPQHSDESFLDATDMRRRAIIARILGLDLLDAALAHIREREKEHQGAIRALSSIIESAASRIATFRAGGNAASTAAGAVKDVTNVDAGAVDRKYQSQITSARDYVQSLKDKLEALEALPMMTKPAKTRAELEEEIKRARVRITSLEKEAKLGDDHIKESRSQLTTLLEQCGQGIKSISVDSLDADRIRLGKLTAQIDQNMLMMGRAKGYTMDEVPARFESAAKRLDSLLEIKSLVTEYVNLGKLRLKDAEHAKIVTVTADRFARISGRSTDLGLKTPAEAKARREALTIDKTLPTECKCSANAVTNVTAAERLALLNSLQRQAFAAGVEIPANIPVNMVDCLARIKTQLDGHDWKKPLMNAPMVDVIEIAQCAIQAVRASSGTKVTRNLAAQLEIAQYCVHNHDRIHANCVNVAEVEYLCALEEQMNVSARSMRRSELRARLDILLPGAGIEIPTVPATATSIAAAVITTVAAQNAREVHHPIPTLKVIGENIFQCERALSLLGDLKKNAKAIRESLALNAEVTALRSKLDLCFSVQRLTLAIDKEAQDIVAIRARIADANESIKALTAQLTPAESAQKEYDEFLAKQAELRAVRENYNRNQAAYLSLVAEANEYAHMRDDLASANHKISTEHQAYHICQLYKMTLDTKTGIQFNLMTSAMGLIEEQANRMLEPIAGLKISIRLGTTSTSVESTPINVPNVSGVPAADGVAKEPIQFIPQLAHGTITRTMHILVRDATTGIEHSAELCSGFQRFIINIALRRAFLYSAVRPMPQFMIIDEGFGCLDDINMVRVCEYLPDLARELKFMLVVSHIDSLNTIINVPLIINVDPHGGICQGSISSLHFGLEDTPTLTETLIKCGAGMVPGKIGRPKKTVITGEAAAAAITIPDSGTSTTITKDHSSGVNAAVASAQPVANSGSVAPAAAASSAPRKHEKSAKKAKPAGPILDPAIVDKRADGTLFCKICGIDFKQWVRHARTTKHIQRTVKRVSLQMSEVKK